MQYTSKDVVNNGTIKYFSIFAEPNKSQLNVVSYIFWIVVAKINKRSPLAAKLNRNFQLREDSCILFLSNSSFVNTYTTRSIYLSIYLSTYLSIYLFFSLLIYLKKQRNRCIYISVYIYKYLNISQVITICM